MKLSRLWWNPLGWLVFTCLVVMWAGRALAASICWCLCDASWGECWRAFGHSTFGGPPS